MASKKKKVRKKVVRRIRRTDDAAIRAQFMADLLDGSLGSVVDVIESRDAQGILQLEAETEED